MEGLRAVEEGAEEPSSAVVNTENASASRRISDDDLYRTSTQFRIWSFKRDELAKLRYDLNAQAAENIQEQLVQFKEVHKNLTEDELEAIDSMAVPLSADEELKFVKYYSKKVQQFACSLNLPTEVTATAISFFRKFFLTNSVLEVHPKNILRTTIFLACKSENYFIGIDSFSQKVKCKKDLILKYEFKLLESLKFTLLNHHPYRALHGFYLDIQSVLNGKVDLDYLGQVYNDCKKQLSEALLTDAVYLYTPPQMTLAVLLIEDEALINRYLTIKFGEGDQRSLTSNKPSDSQDSANTESTRESIKLATLYKIIEECKAVILDKDVVTKEEVTKIDAKLHYCQNPMLVIQRLKRRKDSSVSLSPSQTKKPKI